MESLGISYSSQRRERWTGRDVHVDDVDKDEDLGNDPELERLTLASAPRWIFRVTHESHGPGRLNPVGNGKADADAVHERLLGLGLAHQQQEQAEADCV